MPSFAQMCRAEHVEIGHNTGREDCPLCLMRAVLIDLVKAVEEQRHLDPTVALVKAMKDAKSWIMTETLSS